MKKIVLEAAAKLNLSLDITGVREDGYHLLDSVMQSVSLYDRVALIKREEGISLTVDRPKIPNGPENTAYKAAAAFFRETKIDGGVEIFLEKHIPSRAGMGGGSADAAAVLVGLNELYRTGLSQEKLQKIGLQVGADVPFCIVGGTARVQGIGEVVRSIAPLNMAQFVVVKPRGVGVDTKEAYERYDEIGSSKRPDTEGLLHAIMSGSTSSFSRYMYNVLEESAPLDEIREIKKDMLDYGANAAMMTGSGAAVFGVFGSLILAMATRGRFTNRYHAYLVEPVSRGVRVVLEQ